MTIVNINICIETTEPPEMLNLAEDIEKQVVEALDLKQSPVLTYNVDVDIIEEKTDENPFTPGMVNLKK